MKGYGHNSSLPNCFGIAQDQGRYANAAQVLFDAQQQAHQRHIEEHYKAFKKESEKLTLKSEIQFEKYETEWAW